MNNAVPSLSILEFLSSCEWIENGKIWLETLQIQKNGSLEIMESVSLQFVFIPKSFMSSAFENLIKIISDANCERRTYWIVDIFLAKFNKKIILFQNDALRRLCFDHSFFNPYRRRLKKKKFAPISILQILFNEMRINTRNSK